MTIEELTELFIHGAEVDRRLPNTARPARLKSQALPYVHDWADMAGWGSERHEEERQSFWDSRSTRLRTSDIADWERCNELILLVPDESQRRCLWNWSTAKAGGRPFNKWCRDREHIHPETGARRKDRALLSILTQKNSVNGDFTHQMAVSGLLTEDAVLSDKSSIIGAVTAWIAPGSRPSVQDFDSDLGAFDWASRQNEIRRERDKRRAAAAA